jgi:hypothetical protein
MVIVSIMLVASQSFAGCISDYQCGNGNKCVKPRGSYSNGGICVVPTDEYGNRDYVGQGGSITPTEVSGCQYDSDCGYGRSCLKRNFEMTGICVR